MKLKKFLLQNHWANFNQTWNKASLDDGDSSSNKEPINSHKVNNVVFSSIYQRYDIIICVYKFELFSQVSDVAHGPLVIRHNVDFCKKTNPP